MNEIKQNRKRKLVEEYGPHMNKRWSVYDNKGVLEAWFLDKQKALNWWEENKDRETYEEYRQREKLEDAKKWSELPEIEEDLPF